MKKANVVAEVRSMSKTGEPLFTESIAGFARRHGIAPLKKLGQNFIFDESLCDKIVRVSGLAKGDVALEVGPGPAGLTRSILKLLPLKLIVIETDKRCLPLLEEIQKIWPNLEIHHDDALRVNIEELFQGNPGNKKLHIISNLPYNIGTGLLISWLHQTDRIGSMTLMLQKEVVERIVAKPGIKAYGRLSVICQLVCDVRKCFDVSPKAFYPEPKIWSGIVHLVPKADIPTRSMLGKLEIVTNKAFSGRRKMVKSSLKTLFPDITNTLKELKIDESLRAENLSPNDYLQLSRKLMLCS